MVSSSCISDSDSDDGFYRPRQISARRKVEKQAHDPEPVPLPLLQASQASEGPTPSQEARALAHEDEVYPQKYAIIGDNEHLRRAQAKVRIPTLLRPRG